MYIKGISKVLIVTVFLVSLFLFTPQRVEAAKLPPESKCPDSRDVKIGGVFGVSDTCCPTEAKWVDLIKKSSATTYDTIIPHGSYLETGTGMMCHVKYDASYKDGGGKVITFSNLSFDVFGTKEILYCPLNTCQSDLGLGNFECLTQNESMGSRNGGLEQLVCCVETENSMGSSKSTDACTQATIKAPIGKAGQQIPVRKGNPTLRTPAIICNEDATTKIVNGVKTVDTKAEGDCVACLNSGKQWTALGCIDTGQQGTGIVTFLMQIFYGIGFTFIMVKFILAGIQLQSGDPEAIKEAKETFIAGFSALFVAGFGLILLRFIGFDILGIGVFLGTQFPTVK